MGKYDVDFEDYEGGGGYGGEEPKRGNYTAKLVQLNEHTSGAGNEALHWQYEITEGDFKGWRGHVYTNMTTAKWKTQENALAIQGGSDKPVKLDPGAEGDADSGRDNKTVKKAKLVRIRLINEMYEDERRARIRNVMALGESAGDKDDSDDEDKSSKKSKKKKNKGDEPQF